MNSKLILTLDGEIVNEYALDAEHLSIGRKHGNDIQLNDLTVSGRHAMINSSLPDQVFAEACLADSPGGDPYLHF